MKGFEDIYEDGEEENEQDAILEAPTVNNETPNNTVAVQEESDTDDVVSSEVFDSWTDQNRKTRDEINYIVRTLNELIQITKVRDKLSRDDPEEIRAQKGDLQYGRDMERDRNKLAAGHEINEGKAITAREAALRIEKLLDFSEKNFPELKSEFED